MASAPSVSPAARIAVFLPSLEGGGAERVVLNLVEGLCAKGYDVDLVLAQMEGDLAGQIPAKARVVRLSPLRLPLGRTFAALPLLAGYLRRVQPSVMLTVSDRANIVGLAARKLTGSATRVVVTVHRLFSCEMHGPRWLYLKVIRYLARITYASANAIVAVSRGAALEAAASLGLPSSGVDVIYNPVLTAGLNASADQVPEHPWFRSIDDPPVIVSIGRLEPPKDFETLLRAFAEMRRRQAARLLILGEGPRRQGLVQLARRLGVDDEVDMPGFVQNPYQYMARAGAVVLSSSSEALPTVLIEALYLGRPVVATDCPTGPREILRDGLYGTLVPVGNASSLASAMEKALKAKACRQDPESWRPYMLETATNQYLDVLLRPREEPSPPLAARRFASAHVSRGEESC